MCLDDILDASRLQKIVPFAGVPGIACTLPKAVACVIQSISLDDVVVVNHQDMIQFAEVPGLACISLEADAREPTLAVLRFDDIVKAKLERMVPLPGVRVSWTISWV